MTKDKALYSFFNSFGIDAYPVDNVPDDVVFPWLTYELSVGSFGDPVDITAHLYMKTESEATANNQVETICNTLRNGGQVVQYDDGAMWLCLARPEWLPANDQNDRTIKHRIINITIEYLS